MYIIPSFEYQIIDILTFWFSSRSILFSFDPIWCVKQSGDWTTLLSIPMDKMTNFLVQEMGMTVFLPKKSKISSEWPNGQWNSHRGDLCLFPQVCRRYCHQIPIHCLIMIHLLLPNKSINHPVLQGDVLMLFFFFL